MNGVLVILEYRGSWNRMSWEALAAGKELAAQIHQPLLAAVAGASLDRAAAELASRPLARAYAVRHALLDEYTADGFVAAFEQLIQKLDPALVLFPHTYQVRDFAPRLAARFGQTLIADVVAIAFDSGRPVFVRQLLQGKLNADYCHTGAGPCFVSIQAGAFRADASGVAQAGPVGTPRAVSRLVSTTVRGGEPSVGRSAGGPNGHPGISACATSPDPNTCVVEEFVPRIEASQIRSQPGEHFRESAQTVDLSAASLIVSVGRGIKEQANLPIVEDLAQALGAELAASRPICDNGWLPMERQVGSSGQTVSPKVYIAVGISGAIQHLVGMKGSKAVIAINKDENAPIFEVADYGVVGDLFEVAPALTAAVRKARSV
ncbi:MAG: electron transfer flavoprotein subunit alpha/FixB family protein [Bryobacteraceae bacterium]